MTQQAENHLKANTTSTSKEEETVHTKPCTLHTNKQTNKHLNTDKESGGSTQGEKLSTKVKTE